LVFESQSAHTLLPFLGDNAAEELGAAARPVGKAANSLWRLELAMVDRAQQGKHCSRTHDIAHALAMSQPWHCPALKICFNLLRVRLDHFAHHVTVRSLDHSSKGCVHGQIAK